MSGMDQAVLDAITDRMAYPDWMGSPDGILGAIRETYEAETGRELAELRVDVEDGKTTITIREAPVVDEIDIAIKAVDLEGS